MANLINPVKHLLLRAKIQPEKIAVCDIYDAISYRNLLVLVTKIARKLELLGFKPGDLAITSLPPKFDWIFTNALFHEACITCSNHGYKPVDESLEVDWVISDRVVDNVEQEKLILVDQAWITDALECEGIGSIKPYAADNEVCRLILTSGTTGDAKAVALPLKTIYGRCSVINNYWCGPGSEINMMSLATVGGFFSAINSIMTGGTYYCVNKSSDVVKLAMSHTIDSVTASPIQLASLVAELESVKGTRPSFRLIRSAGGTVSAALLDRLLRMTDAEIYNIYGSTELGGVTLDLIHYPYSPERAGYVLTGVVVEIVDEDDNPLPFGAEGVIRARSNNMVNEYYKNPQATAISFKNGWFYPGDRGLLKNDGLLLLAGRESELINRGGIKINPDTIDRFLADYSGVEDAAVCGVENRSGIQDVVVAIIVPEDFDMKTLNMELLKKFGQSISPVILVRVKQIPRNEMGKVMRSRMSEQLAVILADYESRKNQSS